MPVRLQSEELERAREEARSIVESAETDAATRRDEARVQGREMVEEARELRRQMLRDIAERATGRSSEGGGRQGSARRGPAGHQSCRW